MIQVVFGHCRLQRRERNYMALSNLLFGLHVLNLKMKMNKTTYHKLLYLLILTIQLSAQKSPVS